MTFNIWINRAGPSRIHAMRMLRDNPDAAPLKIHATRTNRTNPSQKFCDAGGWEPGSEASDAEYGQFAVDYVAAHGIQAILPTARMTALAARAQDFADLGCTLLAPRERVCALTDSKTGTYTAADQAGVRVPPHHKVSSAEQFRDAVISLRTSGFTACVKPDTGWAASSFRIIRDDAHTLATLLASAAPVVDLESYATALDKAVKTGQEVPDLIVMPYLDEPEISVDMLCSTSGKPMITVPRSKNGWYRKFTADSKVIEHAHRLAEEFPLAYLTNVQFRFLEGEPVLLEINPRASAGLFHTEATGVNLYWEALRYALTGQERRPEPSLDGQVLLHERVLEV